MCVAAKKMGVTAAFSTSDANVGEFFPHQSSQNEMKIEVNVNECCKKNTEIKKMDVYEVGTERMG